MTTKVNQDTTHTKQYPGLFRRIGAWIYDALVVAAVLMLAGGLAMAVVAILLNTGILTLAPYIDASEYLSRHSVAAPLYSMYLALSVIGFYAYFWCKAGQTLGMRAWKLRIQNADGSNIRLTQALIRMATSAFGLGNLMVPFSTTKQSFQDLMAECEMVLLPKPN
ncbi:RDD family protein [Photobacterium sp. 1_MG-2023]|uniref:RDD family protein n=1 Tax=Photobacterium sp. 1_MG-2023 TaxID=3062646 RepID=UPI0026E17405|nr:RDD family protein [Photobacterium sp. 1_MG-2023]MDO6704868.1 RDD family protein [Photobacterium sp. 1_MG-2023]